MDLDSNKTPGFGRIRICNPDFSRHKLFSLTFLHCVQTLSFGTNIGQNKGYFSNRTSFRSGAPPWPCLPISHSLTWSITLSLTFFCLIYFEITVKNFLWVTKNVSSLSTFTFDTFSGCHALTQKFSYIFAYTSKI